MSDPADAAISSAVAIGGLVTFAVAIVIVRRCLANRPPTVDLPAGFRTPVLQHPTLVSREVVGGPVLSARAAALPSPSPTASKKAKESFLHAVEDFVVKDFLPEIETVIEAEIPSAAPTVSAICQLFERAFHSFRSRKVAQAPVAQAPAAAAPVTAATATAVQIQPAESGVLPVGSTAV